MSKQAKLLERALNNPHGLRFVEAIKLAESFGFRVARVSRSHHILKRAGIPELLNFQNAGGKAKPYQIRQLLELVEAYNLSWED